MPDYIPQIQLPQGMAENLIRLQSQANDPWAALAQHLGQTFSGALQQRAALQRQQQSQNNNTITADQAQSLGIIPPSFPGKQLPEGQQGPVQQRTPESVFPRGIQMSLAEQIMRQRNIADIAGAKGKFAEEKLNIPRTQTVDALFERAGLPLDPKATTVRHEDYDAAVKTILSQQSISGKKEAETSREKAASTKIGMADEKLWETLNRQVNPINAPRGSLLGQAGQGNARADRALTTLSSKTITPQQVQAVVSDFAGIMQGGAPHENALREMGFGNLSTRWTNMMQYITSKPQAINTPEVINQLRTMITEIKDVDNQIINNNLDVVEQTHSGLVTKDPERWQRVRSQILKSTLSPSEQKKKNNESHNGVEKSNRYDSLMQDHGLL